MIPFSLSVPKSLETYSMLMLFATINVLLCAKDIIILLCFSEFAFIKAQSLGFSRVFIDAVPGLSRIMTIQYLCQVERGAYAMRDCCAHDIGWRFVGILCATGLFLGLDTLFW